MKNIKSCLVLFVCVVAVLFLMTGQHSYKATSPAFIGSMVEPFYDEGLHVQAKRYTSQESRQYLSRDLLKRGVHPIQVTIQNNTKKSYMLSENGVGLSHFHSDEIANREYMRNLPRSLALKVAGFLFWPFLIPGTIDTIVSIKTHFSLKTDLYAKSIKTEGEVILPYSTVHRILFVPRQDLQEGFTLYLQENHSKKYTSFPVEIKA